MLIARRWTGHVHKDRATEYENYLRNTGLADYRVTPGNRGALLLRREHADSVEFETMSFWEDVEAIQAFAGEEYEMARYYPEDDRFLIAKSPTVEHFTVPFCSVDELRWR